MATKSRKAKSRKTTTKPEIKPATEAECVSLLAGLSARYAAFAEIGKKAKKGKRVLGGPGTRTWPLRSEALAVHPEQVDEANLRNKRAGVAAYYEPDGTCVIADNGARRRLLRLERCIDRAGYT